MSGPNDDWLYDDSIYKTIVVNVDYKLHDGTTVHHAWSTDDFSYTAQDGLHHKMEGLLKGFPAIQTAIDSNVSISSLELQNFTKTNSDGTVGIGTHFDSLLNSPIEGKSIRVYINDLLRWMEDGGLTRIPRYDDAGNYIEYLNEYESSRLIYSGVVESITASRDKVILTLSNPIEHLDTDLQFTDEDFYTGILVPTEPTVTLKDKKVKPILYGKCFNVSPIMTDVSVDVVDSEGETVNGTLYQVNWGPVFSIDEVREGGNILWKKGSEDEYPNVLINNTDGTFVVLQGTFLGHGALTCDVYGKTSVVDYAQYINYTSIYDISVSNPILIVLDIIHKIFPDIDYKTDLDIISFAELTDDFLVANILTGIFIDKLSSALTVINEVLSSIRCYLYIDSFNRISINRFMTYEAALVEYPDKQIHTIEQDHIIDGSYEITSCEIPNTQVLLTYKKNYTPQPINEQAVILEIPPEDRDPPELADPNWIDVRPMYEAENITYIAKNTDEEELANYNTAIAADEVNTLIYNEAGAIDEATERMKVRSIKRKIYSLKVRNASIYMQIGDLININHYLYNAGNVVNGTIISLSKDVISRITTIEVFV